MDYTCSDSGEIDDKKIYKKCDANIAGKVTSHQK